MAAFAILFRQQLYENSHHSRHGPDDLVTAMKKLADAAFHWDQTNYIGAASVVGFEGFLSPFAFKQQLHRSFAIKLTPAEVGALLSEFCVMRQGNRVDSGSGEEEGDGDGRKVDGYLFLKRFTALQKQVRKDYIQAQLAHKARKDALMAISRVDLYPKSLGR